MAIRRTPLESWFLKKAADAGGAEPLTRTLIESYQLQKLKETLALARAASPFYRRHLENFPAEQLRSLKDLQAFPFTTAGDISKNPLLFLCVSQDQINRVVTINSSGTTGRPKRVFFTGGDQELIRDFFRYGMSTLVEPGDTVLVLLPGGRPGSVGALLAEALERSQVRCILHGFVRDPRETLQIMAGQKVDSLVGVPTQVLALARYEAPGKKSFPVRLKNMLLTTDHVPRAIVNEIERTWYCRVYNHYGMTEMGLGGGVECEARDGCHLREADLYFEIVDPATGEAVPEGEEGEVVFTTLTRQGMPLIRYRTGDIARFVPGTCSCGSLLKRIAPVRDRIGGRVPLAGGGFISMSVLDEALFAVKGVIDFQAAVSSAGGADLLTVKVQAAVWAGEEVNDLVREALLSVPVIAGNIAKGALILGPVDVERSQKIRAPAKRIIQDLRGKE
ncbi:coenzyme F390 synthetase [Pelotomaculum thermopropionicum SI]|uniref:Coenzyme F390 synthetase n=1 Tax=Pelotomaculum thermopropionicum (strain DSM 13744 / JCM 10971 / SI) TaxID=370438 RepID=A5D4G8_PELTS|nr:coenzyme F390 synthetase [Pelotomaculum thermopropionicum SI]